MVNSNVNITFFGVWVVGMIMRNLLRQWLHRVGMHSFVKLLVDYLLSADGSTIHAPSSYPPIG